MTCGSYFFRHICDFRVFSDNLNAFLRIIKDINIKTVFCEKDRIASVPPTKLKLLFVRTYLCLFHQKHSVFLRYLLLIRYLLGMDDWDQEHNTEA